MNVIDSYITIIERAVQIIERCEQGLIEVEINKEAYLNNIKDAQKVIEDAKRELDSLLSI